MQEQQPIIYDNAALSIWNQGSFQVPTPYAAKTHDDAWGAYHRVDPRNKPFGFRPNCRGGEGSCSCPEFGEEKYRVGSLHVHSKNLKAVASGGSACKLEGR